MIRRDVLHVLGTAQPEGTGIARIVGALAAALDKRRYRLHACFLGAPGPLASELETAGAIVSIVDWAGGRLDPIGAWRFWRLLREHEFAVVHQHAGGGSVRALARLCSNARIVVHVHGRITEAKPDAVASIRIRGADAVIATSRAVAKRIEIAANPRVVYPAAGVCDPPSRKHAATTVIGTACRLVPIKAVSTLVEAVALLHEELPGLRLEIAGSGAQLQTLQADVRRLGLDGRVTLLGWKADLAEVFGRWDIFCLPSLEEGFGIAALEAMAASLPVVATCVGGLPELVDHGRTGYLVPPRSVPSLVSALRRLAIDPALRLAMGAAGRERVLEQFTSERMTADIGAIYDDIAV